MRLNKYLVEENTGMGVDGLSKQKLKTLLYKETKKCTYNKLYKDQTWQGVKCIWDIFKKLDLNWQLEKSEYRHERGVQNMSNRGGMPVAKEWTFTIMWDDNKGKYKKMGGNVTAAGAGSVEDPLDRYDVTMVLW